MCSQIHTAPTKGVSFGSAVVHRNLSTAALIERAIRNGEGDLAANGALNVDTGDRTGRSPNDKFLEDTPDIHESINWGKVNRPIAPDAFAELEQIAVEHLAKRSDLYRFDGFAGADPDYRLKVSVFTEYAWHSLFAKTLFINAPADELDAGLQQGAGAVDRQLSRRRCQRWPYSPWRGSESSREHSHGF